ncbi:tenascin-X [Acrasis kona]|uniref:Tenascin-X n=1 Tax=Acrasis kona TaxID=1008807 RepID=A0AAW2ZM34_9EUKA
MSFYVNGALINTTNYNPINSSSVWLFGNNYGANAMFGSLSSTSMYQSELSPSQIQTLYYTTSSICSGNGKCQSNNNCVCNNGYMGPNCASYMCGGIYNYNNSVCNGRGSCVASDNCICSSGYYGANCEYYFCNNVLMNSSSVCGGQGTCSAPNTCVCNSSYCGSNCQLTCCSSVTQKPVLSYNFASNTGRALIDSSLSGNNAFTYSSAQWSTMGPPGYPLSVQFPNSGYFMTRNSFNANSSFTLSTWVLLNVKSASTFLNFPHIYLQYLPTSVGTPSAQIPDFGVWFHTAATYNNVTSTSKLYVNGVLIGSVTSSPIKSSGYLYIGNQDNGIYPVNGLLSGVQVYASDLSASQISTLYTSTSLPCNGNGNCTGGGNCSCNPGYSGPTCQYYYCNGTIMSNQSVCGGGGVCSAPNVCNCNSGYIGQFCQTVTGTCNGANNCTCINGYGGPTCQMYTCYGFTNNDSAVCSSNGACANIDTCICNNGYGGPNCQYAGVTNLQTWSQCCYNITGGGCMNTSCYADNLIVGQTNYTQPVFWEHPDNNVLAYENFTLGGRFNWFSAVFGIEYNNTGYLAMYIYCDGVLAYSSGAISGWYSQNVQVNVTGVNVMSLVVDPLGTNYMDHALWAKTNLYGGTCYGQKSNSPQVCSGNGTCYPTDQCYCNTGYYGQICEAYNCYGTIFNSTSVCSGNGTCNGPNQCICNAGYYGQRCEAYSCYGKMFNLSSVCSANGTCIRPDKCSCYSGYYGAQCEAFSCSVVMSVEDREFV